MWASTNTFCIAEYKLKKTFLLKAIYLPLCFSFFSVRMLGQFWSWSWHDYAQGTQIMILPCISPARAAQIQSPGLETPGVLTLLNNNNEVRLTHRLRRLAAYREGMLIIASRVATGSLCNIATYTPLSGGLGGVN